MAGEKLTDLRCPACGGSDGFPHDHKADLTGLDDGPYLPGRGPRKRPATKTAEESRAIRARAWETRRMKRTLEDTSHDR